MDVHVDQGRIDLEEQDDHRIGRCRNQILIGLTHGMGQETVPNHTAVDEQVEGLATVSLFVGQGGKAGDPDRSGCVVERSQRFDEPFAEQLENPFTPFVDREGIEDVAGLMVEAKLDARERQRIAGQQPADMAQLGSGRLEELATSGHIVEEFADRDFGPTGPGDLEHAAPPASLILDLDAGSRRRI